MKISQDIESKLFHQSFKVGFTLTLIVTIFFGIGVGQDTFLYIQNHNIFLTAINVPLFIILLVSLILLWWIKKEWSTILIVNYSVIIINITLTNYYYLLNLESPEFSIIRSNLVGLVIVVSSAFILKPKWTFIYGIFLSASYVISAIYSENQLLMNSIFIVPMIHIGTAYAIRTFIQLYKTAEIKAIQSEDKASKLQKLMKYEKNKIKHTIKLIEIKAKELNIDISKDLKKITKPIDDNLFEVMFEYGQQMASNESLFFNRLLKSHPNLTSSELKLCYMLVKNLSTKEIAKATSCTPDSVKVFRSRLRKKLNLSSGTTLNNYLKKIETSND